MKGHIPVRPLILAGVLLLAIALPRLAEFYTDWLWFGETGYQEVFLRILLTRGWLGAAAAAVAFLALYGNLRLALRMLDTPVLLTNLGFDAFQSVRPGRRPLNLLAIVLAGTVAALAGVYASSRWEAWLLFRHAVPFGDADPILGRDAAFYTLQLPLLRAGRSLLMLLAAASFAGATAVYVLAGLVGIFPQSGFKIGPAARKHLAALAAVVLLLLAFGSYLDMFNLLVSPSGLIHGASYVGASVRLPTARILMWVSVAGAGLAAYQAFSWRLWPIVGAGLLYVLVAVGGAGYAWSIQRLVVAPNEQAREAPFIARNIAATRKAFGLDGVDERELSGDRALTRQDIDRNAATLKNVRLWDHQPLLDTFGQIQEIRTYYDFASVDNDRYQIGGESRQIMLSARELNSESLPNRTWPNERLTFTHGYGVTLGPVNQVTQEGLPVLFIKNLPPESTVGLDVEEPSVYFGELSNDYVFVRTLAREFHYPKGDDNVYTTYTGEGGVPVGGFWRKLMLSARFKTFNILLSKDLTPESRVLFHRNIRERVRRIAPFLVYDDDPYLVVSEGRLFWIQDAYTVSGLYPYSTRSPGGISYIRNSVKVVIDAYHGRTTYYLADPRDPLAATLGRIFPMLFRPLDDMPQDLRAHIRYPEGIFALQASMYATYHMTNPAVFYNKEDQWEIPSIEDDGKPVPMQPYYTIMKLPGGEAEEFIQMLPFTPRRKDNLAAWLVARSDGAHYGKLQVYQFPKQKVVFGPRQIVARINQDQLISPQITLWNQQGSQVIQGTLLVIPIEESLLYIRPLYLRAAGARIPELKRVVVAHQTQIVMAETLEQALEQIFGTGPGGGAPRAAAAEIERAPAPAPQAADDFVALAGRAREHYERAVQAQRDGNWALYGEELRKLGEVLGRMKKARE